MRPGEQTAAVVSRPQVVGCEGGQKCFSVVDCHEGGVECMFLTARQTDSERLKTTAEDIWSGDRWRGNSARYQSDLTNTHKHTHAHTQ